MLETKTSSEIAASLADEILTHTRSPPLPKVYLVVIPLPWTMPQVYLKKELYDRVVGSKADVTTFVNLAVAEKLDKVK